MRPFFIIILFFIGVSVTHAQSWADLNAKVLDFANAGQMDSAYAYGNKALAQAESEFGKKHFNYTRALNILALVIDMSGDFTKAEQLYLQAVAIQKQITGPNHADYIFAVSQLANTYRDHNNMGKTIFYLQEVANLTKQLNGDQSGEYAKALENLGAAHDDNGEYEKAEPIFIQSRDIRKKVFGEAHPAYASILNNLALLYQHQGKYNAAAALYRQSLAIKKTATGENNVEYAVTLSNLASVYCDMGDYGKAEPLFQQALAIDEKEFGKDSPEAARSLNNLATYYYDLHEDQKAEDLFLKALAINRKLFGNVHEQVAVLLHNLGQLYQRMDEFEKAENSYFDAIEIRKQTLGPEHPRLIGTIMGLAAVFYLEKEYDDAEELFLAALAKIKKNLGENHPDYALGMNNLALIYTDTKRYKESESLLLKAISIAEKNGNDPDLTDYLNNLALLYRQMGMEEKTDELFKKGFHASIQNLQKNFSFLSEAEKEKFSATTLLEFSGFQSFYLDYSKKNPAAAATAFDIELASKGMILNSGVEMRQVINNSGNKQAIALFEKWSELKIAIAKEYALPVSKRNPRLGSMEEQALNYEKELGRTHDLFNNTSSIGKIDLKQIQSQLKENTAIIEFTSFRYRAKDGWTDSVIYAAFVLRRSDPYPKMIRLCEEKQLDSLIKKAGSTNEHFITALYRGLEGQSNQSMSNSKRLYQLIWKPIDNQLSPGDKIYFSPSGMLHQIAFAAIPWDSATLLSDRYKLEQLRSSTALVNAISSKAQIYLSLFGGIEYTMTEQEMAVASKQNSGHAYADISRSITRGGEGAWNYLPGTLSEVKAIASIAEKNKIQYQLIEGKQATEEKFKDVTGKHGLEIIHIASHGFFFPDPVKEKPGALRTDDNVFINSDNPLNRSGIILAGANRAWSGQSLPDGIDDGILTAYEVGNRYFGKSTWMVVLSACETGLGDIKGKEGVFGLQRAFKLAGVEFLMMSLWKVPDQETAEFMEYFYSQLCSGSIPVLAFQATQDFMKKKYPRQPYKWAAFILVR